MKKRILSAMLALIMLMTMVVCMPVKAEAYELTVNNIHWGTGDSEKILSWEPVEGATRYYVSCGTGSGNAYTTSKDLTSWITQSGTYTPTVTAYNGDIQLTEETAGLSKNFVVTPLETPTNVVVDFENGTITWNPVANATQYYAELFRYDEDHGYDCRSFYEGDVYSNTPSVALSKFASSLIDGQQYYFGIQAYDDTYHYGYSDYGHSEKFTYTAPVLPTVRNIHWGTGDSEKILYWDAVEGATRYEVLCGTGSGNAYTTSKDLTNWITQSGTYTPTVTAYNGDIQISKETAGLSKNFVVTPLDAPTNVVVDVDSGTVTWNDVPNATQYYVALYGYNESYGYDCRSFYEGDVYSNTPSVALSKFASSLIDGKQYYFGIQAYDDTYHYGYSDYGHSEKFTYETKYDVTTSVFGEGGTVSPSQRIAKGGNVTITLTPDAGYVVSYLQVNGVDVTSSMVGNTYTISNVQGDKTVVAQFATCHHEWGTGTVTKNATCKEAGIREYTCSICHDTKQETIAKLTAHTWDGGVVTTAPTCKDTGIMTYTCTVCERTKTEIIGATGVHTYGEYTTTTEPTCIATGIEARYCSVCEAKDERTIPATGIHDMTPTAAVAETCTTAGNSAYYTCSICHKFYADSEGNTEIAKNSWVIPAKGHTMAPTAAVAETCTTAGNSAYYTCSDCHKYFSDSEGNAEIAENSWVIPAPGHSYDAGNVTTPATCTAAGVKTFACTKCSDTKTEAISATGHTVVTDKAVAATCTKTGLTEGKHCSVCNTVLTKQEVVPATGHSYDAGKVTKAATCTAEGVKTYTCTKCPATKTEAIAKVAHTPQNVVAIASTCTATGKTAGTICSVCKAVISGCKDVPVKAHTVVTDKAVAATYTKAGKTEGSHCSACGTVIKAQTKVAMTKLAQAKITSVANSKDGITVKWGKVTGATAYQVYRKVGTGSWKLIKTTTSTSMTNTKLTNGTKYQYKVCAIAKVDGKIVNTGVYSAIKTMYRLTRPTLATGTKNIATRKIVVKWNKNTKATGYQVKYVKGSTTKTVKVKGASTLSKTLSSLTKGSTYKVYVRSYKTVSGTTYYSAYSAVKSVKVAK